MKNKILIFTIILTLLITFAPSTVSAANNKALNQKRITERQRFKIKKPTKAQIKAVGSELEYYKQIALEDLDSLHFEVSNYKYSTEIGELIEEYYNALGNEINSYENESDFIAAVFNFFGMEFAVYKDSLMQKFYTFDTLTKFNINTVGDYTAEEFASAMHESINQGFGCYTSKKNQYNDYYLSIIQGDKEAALSVIENASDWFTLAESLGQARMITSNYGQLYPFSDYLSSEVYCSYDEDEEDDYEYDDEYEYEDQDGDLRRKLGINSAPSFYIGERIYDREGIDSIKEGLTIYIQNYINRQLEYANYSIDDAITDMAESAIDEIQKGTNADEMFSVYERTMEKLLKITGVEYKDYNSARYKRLIKQMEELRKTYTDSAVYSDDGIYLNENIIDGAEEMINPDFYIYKDVEIPSDFIERLASLLDETPTYTEELKELKTSLISELNDYKNNKAYNQTKVVPIVNAAVKAIKSATTIGDVWNLYYEYVEKAEATMYKFKITTSKVGKGVISKSATIKYGGSYTVKIKPTVGYKISAIYVDGKKVKLTEKYTFKNINKKHTIKVIFK